MSTASDYLSRLISFDSVSRNSNEPVSDCVAAWLQELNFEVERTTYVDPRGVRKCNLLARRDPIAAQEQTLASGTGGLAYFCHTDTVTADRWTGPGGNPFHAVFENGRIYGRGACDMKGSLAAMLDAAQSISLADQMRPLWIVCTADEEVGFEGAQYLVDHSAAFRDLASLDPVSIIGEPTRLSVIHAHKGIVGMRIRSQGKAAHSSTDMGINANVAMVPMLQTLLEIDEQCRTDETLRNDAFDPPTLTWNFGVSDEMKTVNIVPDHCTAWASMRTMPGVDGREIVERVRRRAEELGLSFDLYSGGDPMHTDRDAPFVKELCELAEPYIGANEPHAVCYATDGCVLGELNRRIVCGPGGIAQAHTSDEFIEIEQLENGVRFYQDAIRHWCC
ncbi:M20 family metallopeptidase [Aporhodopirellula aestuarii]|uniref:M20 family metallopeptidase n=1 Tax=Aporhodopirellula aestuarii TaxID=2950107 RepID=A0ABT0TZG6_9BACT|nr:M20 family metallopeptidase [Aporhodopirellula aestuarii]MCM2370004.1 M20 family metallopeptidase [Aporhodopirellula aestuarii]